MERGGVDDALWVGARHCLPYRLQRADLELLVGNRHHLMALSLQHREQILA
jgi:hypothetical protein